MLVNWKMLKGPLYIRAILRRINLTKQLFILEVEHNPGHVMIIPKDLNQDYLPQSFHFYDSLIRMIQENLNKEL